MKRQAIQDFTDWIVAHPQIMEQELEKGLLDIPCEGCRDALRHLWLCPVGRMGFLGFPQILENIEQAFSGEEEGVGQ